jgi:hypothetical protein
MREETVNGKLRFTRGKWLTCAQIRSFFQSCKSKLRKEQQAGLQDTLGKQYHDAINAGVAKLRAQQEQQPLPSDVTEAEPEGSFSPSANSSAPTQAACTSKKRKSDQHASAKQKKKQKGTIAESNTRVAAKILARKASIPLLHQPAVCEGKRKRTEHDYHAMVNDRGSKRSR